MKNFNVWLKSMDAGVWEICDKVKRGGGTAWLVGGCVRDALVGGLPKEVDLATNLKPTDIVKIFGAAAEPTGLSFGTITVTASGSKFEITTLRREGNYRDGRRPSNVQFTESLLEDLERRDFTINAIAFDLLESKVFDPFGGISDLDKGILRMVGEDPGARLTEDGLRVWRAHRFIDGGQRGLRSVERDLDEALGDEKVRASAGNVSRERIWQELAKVLRGKYASSVMEKMANNDLLSVAFCLDKPIKCGGTEMLAQKFLVPCRRRIQGLRLNHSADSGDKTRNSEDPKYVILDMEATCHPQNKMQPQEVIQFSAVVLSHDINKGTISVVDEFDSFCRPTIHPRLSKFCKSLTRIKQGDVDKSPMLEEVLSVFANWLRRNGVLESHSEVMGQGNVIVTCGNWDLHTLLPRQCEALGIDMPMYLKNWVNAQDVFSSYYWTGVKALRNMSVELGIQVDGNHHNSITDARTLAKVMRSMFNDGCHVFFGDVLHNLDAFEKQIPDIALGRTACILSSLDREATSRCTTNMKLNREERGIVNTACNMLGRLPDPRSTPEMRLYRHCVGDGLIFQLCLEGALVCAKHGGTESKEYREFEEMASALFSIDARTSPLVDGKWIMERTCLQKGQRLGRLKEWLWRIQVEKSLTSVHQIDGVLEEIDWKDSNHEDWPRMQW